MSNSRIHSDWLEAFCSYAGEIGEAPPMVYFWVGVSAIAGALRRRVWIEQGHFRWLSNFYILIVAPPGIIAKSTSTSIGMKLLREVPGIHFGPDVVTWQSLLTELAGTAEAYEDAGTFYTMSAITLESSEFGNLLDPSDRELVDMLVTLWDGKEGTLKKSTKTQGKDSVKNPWVNIIACTTPAWISGYMPEYMIGGGLMSRFVLVFADHKAKLVPYQDLIMPSDFAAQGRSLIADLTEISRISGPFRLSQEAYAWGIDWYAEHYAHRPAHLDNERFGGYIARKQTHMHKLAMVLSASRSDNRVIMEADLVRANAILTGLEAAMPKIFEQVGQTVEAKHSHELLSYVKTRGEVEYSSLFRALFRVYSSLDQFTAAINGAERAGYIRVYHQGAEARVKWILAAEPPTPQANIA